MFHRFCAFAALLAVGLGIGATRAALADVYLLNSGGQVQGELVNSAESPRQQYVVRTAAGATVTFDRKQLKQIVPQSPAELEYEKIRPTFADTVDGQWELSEWCSKNSLTKQRTTALERVIELDADHKQARMALGYSFLDGKWMRHDEWQREHGKVLHKGEWLLPQEIEIVENRRKNDLAQKKWFLDLRKWRNWLNDSAKSKEAEEQLKAINDPAAVPAVVKNLKDENDPQVRSWYIQALGRIYSGAAINALVDLSILDQDAEVRISCIEELAEKPNADITAKYVPILRNRDNLRVNRAGLALGKLGDKSAIRPLIDSLVTTHKFQVTSGSGSNSMSAGFGSNGGGFSAGSSTRIISQDMQNQSVLDALVILTGQNFDYDEVAWRNWYAAQNKAVKVNSRRD